MIFAYSVLLFFCFHLVAGQESRIVGGETAHRRYPFQISLQMKNPNSTQFAHICGGSIVSKNCVVTAAHCVVEFKPQDLSILAGTNKLEGGNGKRYFIREINVNPGHKNSNNLKTYDVAVVKINGKFNYSKSIAPIKYSRTRVRPGIKCTVTGWGLTNKFREGKPPNDLQRATFSTIPNSKCRTQGNINIQRTEICTRKLEPFSIGTCSGDSGGPLTIGDGKELIGIVSFGPYLCGGDYDDTYTRVSEFYDWITQNCAS